MTRFWEFRAARQPPIHFRWYNCGIDTKDNQMACPFFMPTIKFDDGGWVHPARLPLGGGRKGHCCAPGNEGAEPSAAALREWCNLGYASTCPHRPKDCSTDAVRFSVARDSGLQVRIVYSCESGHRPAGHGTLDYDVAAAKWISSHPDPRIQRMAECYLESRLTQGIGRVPTAGDAS
jgi:hypothetical protein